MKVLYRWQIGGKFIYPLHFSGKHTFGAMPVPARVVRLFNVTAMITLVGVSAQSRSSAFCDGIKCF